jgi:hypothetical protein
MRVEELNRRENGKNNEAWFLIFFKKKTQLLKEKT